MVTFFKRFSISFTQSNENLQYTKLFTVPRCMFWTNRLNQLTASLFKINVHVVCRQDVARKSNMIHVLWRFNTLPFNYVLLYIISMHLVCNIIFSFLFRVMYCSFTIQNCSVVIIYRHWINIKTSEVKYALISVYRLLENIFCI